MGKTVKSIPRKSMEQLQNYSWPDNVRELNNVIERAMILSTGPALLIEVPTLAEPAPRLTLRHGVWAKRHNTGIAVFRRTIP